MLLASVSVASGSHNHVSFLIVSNYELQVGNQMAMNIKGCNTLDSYELPIITMVVR